MGIGEDRVVLEWTKADEEAFARFMLRRRWLNVVQREGVVTVAQLRARSEEQLREIPNLGPLSIADISAAVSDRALRPDDPIEMLALPAARPIRERDEELIRMRQQGATLAQLGRWFGISRGRVEQILDREGW